MSEINQAPAPVSQEMPPWLIRLIGYVEAYIFRFNTLCADMTAIVPHGTLYSEKIKTAIINVTVEGTCIFYRRAHEASMTGLGQEGICVYNIEDESLTHLVQSMTGDLLRISSYPIGASMLSEPYLPPDIPLEDRKGGINPDVLKPYVLAKTGCDLTALAIGPTYSVANGVIAGILPSRKHVFSPVVEVPPDRKPLLQFLFPFADFVWLPEELGLNEQAGTFFAGMDIEALRLGLLAGIPQKQLAEDPFESVARHFDHVCDRFHELVDNPETKEDKVQAFLEIPGHQFLIAPHSKEIHPHKAIGGSRFIPDFTVLRTDGDYHLIEIESPNVRIYQNKGEEPTANFTHAIQQVEDWLRYVELNLHSVRQEDGLPTIYKPTGEVVIGRDKHLGETARKRFQYKRAESPRIQLKTYDDLLISARDQAEFLRRMKSTVAPPSGTYVNNPPPAPVAFDLAISLIPDYSEVYVNQGNALGRLGRIDEELAAYDRAITLRPNYPEAHLSRGIVLIQLERFDEALAAYDHAITLRPDYPEAHFNRGVALGRLERTDEAVTAYDRAITLRPDYPEAHVNQGNALGRLKRFNEALAAHDRAITLRPDFHEAHLNRGIVLGWLKRLGEALAAHDRAITLRPDYPEAHFNRGVALGRLERTDEAVTAYDRAITLRPDYPEAHFNRGNALVQLERFDEAVTAYDRAIALRCDEPEVHVNQGTALGELERFDEALVAYDHAITLRPDYSEAHLNRGIVLGRLGRFREARDALRRAAEIAPLGSPVADHISVVIHWIEKKQQNEPPRSS